MAQSYEFQAESRERVGKGSARALRREGKIPAVIYGDGKPTLSISLSTKEATMHLNAGGFKNKIGTVVINEEKIQVLPRDFQLHPVRDFILHIDFLRVSAKSTVTVEVPVRFINETESPGLKRGGALNVVRYAIEMECLANAIPEAVTVDLTGLEIGDSVHVSGVELPENATPTISDRDFTIATIAGAIGLGEEETAEDKEGGGEEGRSGGADSKQKSADS